MLDSMHPSSIAVTVCLPVVLLLIGCSGTKATPLPTFSPFPTATPTNMPTPAVTSEVMVSPQAEPSAGKIFIRLVDPLDEPEFYCVDVPGAGRGVRLKSALQAHTCKPLAQAADELFTLNHPSDGRIYMEAYELCVEAGAASTPAAHLALYLKDCSDSPTQRFVYTADGLMQHVTDAGMVLCLSVAPGAGIPTGGPSHLRRELSLQICDIVQPPLAKWTLRAGAAE